MNEAEAERIVREALLVAGNDCRCRLCGDFERHPNCQDRDCALRFDALEALDSLVAQGRLRDAGVHGFAGFMRPAGHVQLYDANLIPLDDSSPTTP